MQIVRCKLVNRLIVFFANRIVGELSAAGKLDTWPDRPGPMASRARQGISIPGQIARKLDNWPDMSPSRSKWVFRSRSRHPSRSKSVDRGRSRWPRSVELVRGQRPGASGVAPRRPNSTPSRAQERQTPEVVRTARSRTIVGAIFRRTGSIFGVVATPANPPKYRACQQKRRFGTSRCTTSCSHDVTSKNDENRVQNRSKVDRSRSFGVHRGAQVDRSWSFGVSRSAKVDRSGSIEARQVELARRAGTRVRRIEGS